jgi:hypothetical protein
MSLLGAISISRRRITHYGIYRHDVKVDHPPKQQPKLWRLPVHRKLVYVSPGWFYRKVDGQTVKTTMSCISFVKSASHKLLETLTKEEFNFLIDNQGAILKEFDRVATEKASLEQEDMSREHICK